MNILLNCILCLINASLMVYLFFLFFSSFEIFRFKQKTTILCALIIIPLFTLVLLFVKIFLVKFLLIIFLIILISLLIKTSWHKSLLLSGVAYASSAIAEALVTFLLSLIFSISNQQAVDGPFFIIGLLLSKVLFFLVILLIRHFIKKNSSATS